MDDSTLSIWRCFANLRDPRRSRRAKKHLLLDIVAIALCAVIAGAEDWPQVVAFGVQRREWLQTFLSLPNGIPSRSTFERVFAALSPSGLQSCLRCWLHSCGKLLGLDHVAIDGKTLRASGNDSKDLGALHLVSAWASKAHLSLGQVAVDCKSNEITAIPLLLRLLDVKGALVTIDAMGCQKDIAAQIVDAGGDYVLTVKENQKGLYEDIMASFAQAAETGFQGYDWDSFQTEERGHGRYETRLYRVMYNLEGITDRALWKNLTAIGTCFCTRQVGDKESWELRLFIGSRRASAKQYGGALRGHWSIENNQHWQLDVTFGEDHSRIQQRNSAQNMALLRKWALSLLKQHPDKHSIAVKRFKAALGTDYLEEILDA